MSGKIYLIQDDNSLQALNQEPYINEDLLQTLLAQYPDLLAGEQMNEDEPRRWLLIDREIAIPSEVHGAGGGWLDHLFVDQDAIPTLVEVKRSSDTRIRREVVGQLLDYAANAVLYLPVQTLQTRFEALCEKRGDEPTTLIAELVNRELDDETAVKEFWEQVKVNLQAGRIRLVFVADEIPPELRRIVEFLNEQMDPAEVLAVEIKQYVGQGLRTLVPRLIGATATAEQKKGGRGPERQWDEASFFADLQDRQGEEVAAVAQAILDWASPQMTRVWWGRGKLIGSFVPILNHNGRDHQLFAVWSSGGLEVYFQWYQHKPPFTSEAKRLELLDRLNAIPGISIPPDAITRRPNFFLSALKEKSQLETFLQIFDWVIQEIRTV